MFKKPLGGHPNPTSYKEGLDCQNSLLYFSSTAKENFGL